jgi:hypothetical protein
MNESSSSTALARPEYWLDRGNGVYTPMIPADQLPEFLTFEELPLADKPASGTYKAVVGYDPHPGTYYQAIWKGTPVSIGDLAKIEPSDPIKHSGTPQVGGASQKFQNDFNGMV